MRGLAAVVVVLGVLAGPGAASAFAAFHMDVQPASVTEGGVFTVTVHRTAGAAEGSVKVVTGDPTDTAEAPADYTPVSQTVTWGPSDISPSKTVQIQTNGADTLDEDTETITVRLTDSTEGYDGVVSQSVAIQDDDPPPTVTIADASVTEGTSTTPTMLSFTLTLSTASGRDAVIGYATADGTAVAGQDYTATAGTKTIPKGSTTAKVDVPVAADYAIEPDETFTMTLSPPDPDPGTAALGTPSTATGTITNDDVVPTLSIAAPPPQAEGSSGLMTPFEFVIALSRPSATPTIVTYATSDGTAMAPADYVEAEQTVTFAPGETSKTVPIAVRADTDIEPNEDFSVSISNTGGLVATVGTASAIIVDDDAPKAAPGPGGGPAPPAVADRTPPAIKLSKVTSSRGIVRLRVSCPVGEQMCRGTVSVYSVPARKSKIKALRRELKIGSSLFVLQGGQQGRLTFHPSGRASQLLRRARTLRVRAYAVARDGAGNVGTARSKGTVRAGRR